jgi:hypothetical protein
VTREDKLRIIGDDSLREFTLSKGSDQITVKVTEDGRYRADITGSVSAVNHGNADSFLKDIARVLGGVLKITRQGHAHGHTHTH